MRNGGCRTRRVWDPARYNARPHNMAAAPQHLGQRPPRNRRRPRPPPCGHVAGEAGRGGAAPLRWRARSRPPCPQPPSGAGGVHAHARARDPACTRCANRLSRLNRRLAQLAASPALLPSPLNVLPPPPPPAPLR